MRRRFALALALLAGVLGCGGDGHVSRAEGTLPDGGPICPGPITNDMGISSLFDLPLADVCGSTYGYANRGHESKPCEGTIMVVIEDGVDTALWWLFDAETGDLDAVGAGGAGTDGPGCEGARPGFLYPYQCDNDGAWTLDTTTPSTGAQLAAEWTDLCTDASAVQATDAGDACAPSSCPESCPSGTQSYFALVDGCVVWQCCV
jgi:hypothetical protein